MCYGSTKKKKKRLKENTIIGRKNDLECNGEATLWSRALFVLRPFCSGPICCALIVGAQMSWTLVTFGFCCWSAGRTWSIYDISAQQNRPRTFLYNKICAGQNRHRSESAQKKKWTNFAVFGVNKNKNRTQNFAFNGNSLRLEHDCIFALPLRLSVNHSHTFKVTILRSTLNPKLRLKITRLLLKKINISSK